GHPNHAMFLLDDDGLCWRLLRCRLGQLLLRLRFVDLLGDLLRHAITRADAHTPPRTHEDGELAIAEHEGIRCGPASHRWRSDEVGYWKYPPFQRLRRDCCQVSVLCTEPNEKQRSSSSPKVVFPLTIPRWDSKCHHSLEIRSRRPSLGSRHALLGRMGT